MDKNLRRELQNWVGGIIIACLFILLIYILVAGNSHADSKKTELKVAKVSVCKTIKDETKRALCVTLVK